MNVWLFWPDFRDYRGDPVIKQCKWGLDCRMPGLQGCIELVLAAWCWTARHAVMLVVRMAKAVRMHA
jgi:hypothetical protein